MRELIKLVFYLNIVEKNLSKVCIDGSLKNNTRQPIFLNSALDKHLGYKIFKDLRKGQLRKYKQSLIKEKSFHLNKIGVRKSILKVNLQSFSFCW